MVQDPQDIAQELWDLLDAGGSDVLCESDVPLVSELRKSLSLPTVPATSTPITIPGRRNGVSVELGVKDEGYVVKRGSLAETPVEIETRKGVLVVDPDDPLARAQRSIEKIAEIKF